MNTRKLYYENAFLTRFSAEVLYCETDEHYAAHHTESKVPVWRIALNQTAFYPEGGGQPADQGILGGVRVLDVHEQKNHTPENTLQAAHVPEENFPEEIIWHICDGPLNPGQTVEGVIDWKRRFDHMQQHSGEHIISGILCENYHCDNVGFHLGADSVTIDYNTDLTWEQVMAAEYQANQIIWKNAPVEIAWPNPSELAALHYRSKKALTGAVRIVTFPNADCCACCGTHVKQAGQVGIIKVLSCQKFRDGVRLEILCGERAFAFLSQLYDQSRKIAQQCSVKPLQISHAVERLETELNSARERIRNLEDIAFSAIADAHSNAGDIVILQPPMRGDSVVRLADSVARQCGGLAAVFSGSDTAGQYIYALVRADKQDISAVVRAMNQALNGCGGGRNGFAQGSVHATQAEIQAYFQK